MLAIELAVRVGAQFHRHGFTSDWWGKVKGVEVSLLTMSW